MCPTKAEAVHYLGPVHTAQTERNGGTQFYKFMIMGKSSNSALLLG